MIGQVDDRQGDTCAGWSRLGRADFIVPAILGADGITSPPEEPIERPDQQRVIADEENRSGWLADDRANRRTAIGRRVLALPPDFHCHCARHCPPSPDRHLRLGPPGWPTPVDSYNLTIPGKTKKEVSRK